MNQPRRIVLLTEGHSNPITAKTAASVIRYCSDEVLAVLDATKAGGWAAPLLGVGADLPVIASLDETPAANTLMIGIAPPGGKIPSTWRPIIRQALERGMTVVSGLHDFLSADTELAAVARQANARIVDVRDNDEQDVADRRGIRPDCLRIQTVGNDCCVGKMVTALELTAGLQQSGHDAHFVATGQTGIMIAGSGCPVDRVIADFINGAVEKLVLANQQHAMLIFEGQGSLAHPRYSAVTLGLLHGAMPHGLILCCEAGRTHVHGMPHVPLEPLDRLRTVYERVAALAHPCRVIGISANTRNLSDEESREYCGRLSTELNLPACDPIRHGTNPLVEATVALQRDIFACN